MTDKTATNQLNRIAETLETALGVTGIDPNDATTTARVARIAQALEDGAAILADDPIGSISDVQVSNPQNDDLLVWNGSTWVNTPVSVVVPSLGLKDLSDVDPTLAPSSQEILSYNGTNTQWESTPSPSVQLSKGFTVELPRASENIAVWYVTTAIIISEIRAVLVGSGSPSVTWRLRHDTDRSDTGTLIKSKVTTNTTTGDEITSFDDDTVPAGSFIFFKTTAMSGNVEEISLTIDYSED